MLFCLLWQGRERQATIILHSSASKKTGVFYFGFRMFDFGFSFYLPFLKHSVIQKKQVKTGVFYFGFRMFNFGFTSLCSLLNIQSFSPCLSADKNQSFDHFKKAGKNRCFKFFFHLPKHSIIQSIGHSIIELQYTQFPPHCQNR